MASSNAPATTAPDSAPDATTEVVGTTADLDVGAMKMAKVGERRIVVVRTPSGVHALDNACPHQGYGLATGSLDGELLTCQWHNWKFRTSDGRCIMGEEDVACHHVEVAQNGEIAVTVVEPSKAERLERLWPSLTRGFDKFYVGQMARDTARLLDAGAQPSDVVWHAIERAAPRAEFGIGHDVAMASDCLHLLPYWSGLEQTLPVVQALSGLSESNRDRPAATLPAPDASIDLGVAIEEERVEDAMASVLGQLEAGVEIDAIRIQFIDAVGQHHLSYGHGAIYVQKVFELLDTVGHDRASGILPWLAMTVTYGTREDTLPYMRKAMAEITQLDLEALVEADVGAAGDWIDTGGALLEAILSSPEAAVSEAAQAVLDGSGIEGLLNTTALAVSERLLRYDPNIDFDAGSDFGWLDITHGLTYVNAARWAWQHHPSSATARLALFTVFLAHDTGRAERRLATYDTSRVQPAEGASADDLARALATGDPDVAVAATLALPRAVAAETIARASMDDHASAFIVVAHVVKLAQAAAVEAEATGSNLPLAAAARFAAAPRLERFVRRNVAEAIDFVRTGAPPKR